MIDVLKQGLRPESPVTLLAIVALGVAALHVPRLQRWGRRWLTLVMLGYACISTPLVAGWLVAGLLSGAGSLRHVSAAQGADTIVVLSGGIESYRAGDGVLHQAGPATVLRALEAARLARLLDRARVVASGGVTSAEPGQPAEGEVLRDTLIQVGVAPDRIVLDANGRNTREQAASIKRLLASRGAGRFVLVTSSTHMRRSLSAFRAEGLDPIGSEAAVISDGHLARPRLVPTEPALRLSGTAIYDYAANVYYFSRRWLNR